MEVIQHRQVQMRLTSSVHSNTSNSQVQISNIALWGLQSPSKELQLPFSLLLPIIWNLAYPGEMLFREITQIPPTSTCFSFPELSQGCQVAFLHENKLFRDAISYGLPAFETRMPSGTRSGWNVSPATTKEALSQFLALWIYSALEITQTS